VAEAGRVVGTVHAVQLADVDVAVGELLQAGDQAQAGRFAAAGRPDQDEELLVLDGDIDVVDGDDFTKPLGDVIEGETCHNETSLLHSTLRHMDRHKKRGGWTTSPRRGTRRWGTPRAITPSGSTPIAKERTTAAVTCPCRGRCSTTCWSSLPLSRSTIWIS